jgi:hypothetical protein
MKNLTTEQKVEALIATSPLRYLLNKETTFWVSWDQKTVTLAGIKIGDVEWSREAMTVRRGPSPYQFFLSLFGRRPEDDPVLMEYSVIDIAGQKWLGKGYPGQSARFVRCDVL